VDAGQLAAFLAVSALVIVTPGQDTLLTIKNTLVGGRRAGVLTAAGVAAGQAVWTLSTSVGVTALLVASERAFLVLRLAGAAYLVFLGAQALTAAVRGRVHPTVAVDPRGGGSRTAFRHGLLSNLANPKMAVFFTSLLPQFAPAGDAASFAVLLALGLLFCTLTLLWLAAYAAVVSRAGDLLRRSRVRRVLEGLAGAVLVALGIRVAAGARP
jgi:threonine/homoserine/homoserine lactone efflux protein